MVNVQLVDAHTPGRSGRTDTTAPWLIRWDYKVELASEIAEPYELRAVYRMNKRE